MCTTIFRPVTNESLQGKYFMIPDENINYIENRGLCLSISTKTLNMIKWPHLSFKVSRHLHPIMNHQRTDKLFPQTKIFNHLIVSPITQSDIKHSQQLHRNTSIN